LATTNGKYFPKLDEESLPRPRNPTFAILPMYRRINAHYYGQYAYKFILIRISVILLEEE
jgi:hypothetical protein